MRDALETEPSLHCNEQRYNIEFCANLGHCEEGMFFDAH